MARLTAPLLSLGASGSIGKALVFAHWKGIPYARRYVIPENPQTAAQLEVRGIFSTLSEMWKRMPVGARAPFLYAVRGLALTPRNRHVQVNVAALQGDANLDDLVMSISTGQSVPPATLAAADAGGQTIDVTLTPPVVPVGYTLEWMEAAAIRDGDPSPVLTRTTIWGQDDVAPYVINLDVGVADTYQVAGWCHFASGGIYYISAALRDQVVVA